MVMPLRWTFDARRRHSFNVILVIQMVCWTCESAVQIDMRQPMSNQLGPDIDVSSQQLQNSINQSASGIQPVEHAVRMAMGATSAAAPNLDELPYATVPRAMSTPSPPPPQPSTTTAAPPTAPTLPAAGNVKSVAKSDFRKRKVKSVVINQMIDWQCPNITANSRYLECSCDIPYALRCSGDIHGLEQIANGLRASKYSVSLLDCTLNNVTFLSDARIFENVSLHGLVISSGDIKRVHRRAFMGMKGPLEVLGLPNNALPAVPWQSLSALTSLDRLYLSSNQIKYLGASDFLMLQNLSVLDLSENHISGISMRAFLTLKKLEVLKLNANSLSEAGNDLQAIAKCVNLKELDLSSNLLRGPLTHDLLPPLKTLETLNLNTNLLTSIQTGAFEAFPLLRTLSLHHNQIDVLQNHAFSGLNMLHSLDLSYNGIVAVSSDSLKHLSRLTMLNLTHNFLRTLSADLIAPLPSLQQLCIDGNDISIVAKNAFDTTDTLAGLSLADNPLSCDCSMRSFAEWMSTSKLSAQDRSSAVCATPPHLEGAVLQEIPLDSFNCDANMRHDDNANIFQQLQIRSTQNNNLTYVKKLNDDIMLKNIHLSLDYGLILTWSVSISEFSCDAVVVYRVADANETLLNNWPVHCESSRMDNENVASVMLSDISRFVVGDNYRFCLVLIEELLNDQHELTIGCSNQTKLKQIDNSSSADSDDQTRAANARLIDKVDAVGSSVDGSEDISDISSFERISAARESDERDDFPRIDGVSAAGLPTVVLAHSDPPPPPTTTQTPIGGAPSTIKNTTEQMYASRITYGLDGSFYPGIIVGILIAIVFALIGIAMKLSNSGRMNNATVCYAAADQHSNDIENSNRYLKLQATTTL